MIESILITLIVGIFAGTLLAFLCFRARAELMARRLGDEIGERMFQDKRADLESLFEEKFRAELSRWKVETERGLRRDALDKSRAVLKGRLAEQMAPVLPGFGYDPSDARFIGTPVDYVVFDGYTRTKEGTGDTNVSVVLLEVKTGGSRLTRGERLIEEAINAKRVRFETLRM